MRNVWTITKRELYAYFSSPLAYIVMAAFLLVEGFLFQLFLTYSNLYRQPMAMSDMMASGWLYFFLILYAAVVTMRLLAEEQRSGTLEVVLTAPIRDWELVVGKYLASLGLFALTVVISLYQVAILAWVGDPDLGATFSLYVGFFFVGAALLAIGTMASTFTSNQPAAAILAIGVGVVMWLLQFAGPQLYGTFWGEVLERIALFTHYNDFANGLFGTVHVVYYITIVAASLFLATQALQARRWR
jgi:ABC-2 type transport system permease protein